MPHIVDPRPQVEANLERLRVEHQPGIDEAKRTVAARRQAAGRRRSRS